MLKLLPDLSRKEQLTFSARHISFSYMYLLSTTKLPLAAAAHVKPFQSVKQFSRFLPSSFQALISHHLPSPLAVSHLTNNVSNHSYRVLLNSKPRPSCPKTNGMNKTIVCANWKLNFKQESSSSSKLCLVNSVSLWIPPHPEIVCGTPSEDYGPS